MPASSNQPLDRAVTIRRRPVPADGFDALRAAGFSRVEARIHASRGITDPAEVRAGLASLPVPGEMLGCGEAAARLADAVSRGERILIVGDYDADGATGTAVGMRGLREMGATVGFKVPNRFLHGYGLTPGIVDEILAEGTAPRLLLTVDNGIASHDGVKKAAAAGIDVLVTDHHLPAATLPSPAIVVNPNRPGCRFPSKNLAGVGVLFYVLCATLAELRRRGRLPAKGGPRLEPLLDLVALGTVADVVPLDRVNRILVSAGLARIRGGKACPGVAALFSAAKREPGEATCQDLGYFIGPRINAAGRMTDMTLGIRCLLAGTPKEAGDLAGELDLWNKERRAIERGNQEEALLDLPPSIPADTCTISLHRADWHQGVVGLVASRIKDLHHRPTFVFAGAEAGTLKGSGRSIPGFHLKDALERVDRLLPGAIVRFGGHAAAAGMTLLESRFRDFADAFERVGRASLTPELLARAIETDGPLAEEEMTPELARALRDGVWGQGYPPPLFDDVFRVFDQEPFTSRADKTHLRLRLANPRANRRTVLFNRAEPVPSPLHAVYCLERDTFERAATPTKISIRHWRDADREA